MIFLPSTLPTSEFSDLTGCYNKISTDPKDAQMIQEVGDLRNLFWTEIAKIQSNKDNTIHQTQWLSYLDSVPRLVTLSSIKR